MDLPLLCRHLCCIAMLIMAVATGTVAVLNYGWRGSLAYTLPATVVALIAMIGLA